MRHGKERERERASEGGLTKEVILRLLSIPEHRSNTPPRVSTYLRRLLPYKNTGRNKTRAHRQNSDLRVSERETGVYIATYMGMYVHVRAYDVFAPECRQIHCQTRNRHTSYSSLSTHLKLGVPNHPASIDKPRHRLLFSSRDPLLSNLTGALLKPQTAQPHTDVSIGPPLLRGGGRLLSLSRRKTTAPLWKKTHV